MKKERVAKTQTEYYFRQILSYVVIGLIILVFFGLSSTFYWLTMLCVCLVASTFPTVGLIAMAAIFGLATTIFAVLHYIHLI